MGRLRNLSLPASERQGSGGAADLKLFLNVW
jgi:hypothetical protein